MTTNKSGSSNPKSSLYCYSRPDLVMYKGNCGVIVIETSASEEFNDETGTSLSGGITENKSERKGDVRGQLLGGMDKKECQSADCKLAETKH